MENQKQELYMLARRAKDCGNDVDAANFYNQLQRLDPNAWEPMFYSVYFTAMQTTIANISSSAILLSNSLKTAVELASKSDNPNEAICEIINKTTSIAEMMYLSAKNNYDSIDSSIKSRFLSEYNQRVSSCLTLLDTMGNVVEPYFINTPDLRTHIAIPWMKAVLVCGNDANFQKERIAFLIKAAKFNRDFAEEELQKRKDYIDGQILTLSNPKEPRVGLGCFVFSLSIASLSIGFGFAIGGGWGTTTLTLLGMGAVFFLLGCLTMAIPKKKSPERIAECEAEIATLKLEKANIDLALTQGEIYSE